MNTLLETLEMVKQAAEGDVPKKTVKEKLKGYGSKASDQIGKAKAGAGKKYKAVKEGYNALSVGRKNSIKAALAVLAASGVGAGAYKMKKKASEENFSDIDLAKIAAMELAEDALQKLAYADQLFNEATFYDEVIVKQAAEAEDMNLESDGTALDMFLEELNSEDAEDEVEDEEAE